MSDKKLVVTIYGKRSKFEIYEVPKTFGGKEFIIHKDGGYWKGTFVPGQGRGTHQGEG